MAHFAKIENGIVTQVIVVNNNDTENKDFPDSEPVGQAFLRTCGFDGLWLQTSYNRKFRKNYAGVGYEYHEDIDAFIPPKSQPSWVLNSDLGIYEPPLPCPTSDNDDEYYEWQEITRSWVLRTVGGDTDGPLEEGGEDTTDVYTQYVGGGDDGDNDETLATKTYPGMPTPE